MKITKLLLIALLAPLSFNIAAAYCDTLLRTYPDFSPEKLYNCSDDRYDYCVGINFQGNNSRSNSFAFMGDGSQVINGSDADLFEQDGRSINIVGKYYTPSYIIENFSLTKNSKREIGFIEIDRGQGAVVSIKSFKRDHFMSDWKEISDKNLHCSKIN